MSKPDNAKTLGVNADISECSVEAAAELLPPSRTYTIKCSPYSWYEAKRIYRKQALFMETHSLVPVVNIIIEPSYAEYEWSFHSGAECVWSPGA